MGGTKMGSGEGMTGPRIAVIGVGGAGCNVVSMFYNTCCPVETVAVNTDRGSLDETSADVKIHICKEVTKGEGAFGDVRIGRKCAKVHEAELAEAIEGRSAVFLIAGMGGGTGTGASSVIAEICARMDVMCIAVAIEPFSVEGRMDVAVAGLRSLESMCRNVIALKNDKIFDIMSDAGMEEALAAVNRSIVDAVMGAIPSIPDLKVSRKGGNGQRFNTVSGIGALTV